MKLLTTILYLFLLPFYIMFIFIKLVISWVKFLKNDLKETKFHIAFDTIQIK